MFRTDRTARFVSRAQQATDVNVAILSCTAIAVEETVLVDGVLIVAWNPGCEATFIIVERTGAFWIVAVGAAVAVVVLAVGALRGAWNAVGRRERIGKRCVAIEGAIPVAVGIAVVAVTAMAARSERKTTCE